MHLGAPLLTLSEYNLDGLTSKPHHAPRRFGRITWIALPATGIDFQPQTRMNHPSSIISENAKKSKRFYELS